MHNQVLKRENPEAQQGNPSGESNASQNTETVDADFEVVDDEDKNKFKTN